MARSGTARARGSRSPSWGGRARPRPGRRPGVSGGWFQPCPSSPFPVNGDPPRENLDPATSIPRVTCPSRFTLRERVPWYAAFVATTIGREDAPNSCERADAALVRAFDLLGKRWTGVLLGTLR